MKCMLIRKQLQLRIQTTKSQLSFKGCEKLVLEEIENARGEYFNRVFTAYKSDMKKTWQAINETLSRNSKKIDMPSKFIHGGCELENPTEIANAFNSYFANIGKKLSSKIEHDDITVHYKQYFNLSAVENLQFKCITEETAIKAIDELKNKSSSGHDGISNKFLEVIKCNI